MTRNDNFIVSDTDDTLKNSLSFGRNKSIQNRLQSSNDVRYPQFNADNDELNKIPLPKDELNYKNHKRVFNP